MTGFEGAGDEGSDDIAGTAGEVAPDWIEHALAGSSDLLLVIAADTTVTWCNRTALRMLGHRPDAVVGRSFAEFLHPDDLARAADVLALAEAGAFDRDPITPALYRARSVDGTWIDLDINASSGPDGALLVIGRVGGDLVLTDRLLEAVTGRAPFQEQLALVLELGRWRHPRDRYAILYRDTDGTRRAYSTGLPELLQGLTTPVGPTPWGAAARTGAEVVIDDFDDLAPDSRLASPALAQAAIEAGFVGCLVALVTDPAHPEGAALAIWTTAEGPTTSGHRYAMSTMRRLLALVLQQRAQLQGLEEATWLDPLTGAVSRARFHELLDQVHADAHPSTCHTLLYVDLDGFKAVNDRHGHAAGDQVLEVAAGRLVAATPRGALVARLGGDEFAVLCPAGTTAPAAVAIAQAVVDVVAEPVELADADGLAVVVGASVGVAVGLAGDHPAVALDRADAALLAAKAEGRGRWSLATR